MQGGVAAPAECRQSERQLRKEQTEFPVSGKCSFRMVIAPDLLRVPGDRRALQAGDEANCERF